MITLIGFVNTAVEASMFGTYRHEPADPKGLSALQRRLRTPISTQAQLMASENVAVHAALATPSASR
jgi:ABC-type uncharacterized transport system auxiliary subunit